MKQILLLLSLALMPWALFAQTPLEGQTGNADPTAKWWNKLSVEIHTGFSYMNDLWPYTGRGQESLMVPPAWDGHNYGIALHYDMTETWRVGIGMETRRRGDFMMKHLWYTLLGNDFLGESDREMKWLIRNWNGIIDIPVTAEYHKGWFYAHGGIVVECSIPMHDGFSPVPPPEGYGWTIIKWWHGGVTASAGGLIPLFKHSTLRLGLEACVTITPYANYAEDWIDVMPSDRRYRLYTGWYCGITAGYVFHF